MFTLHFFGQQLSCENHFNDMAKCVNRRHNTTLQAIQNYLHQIQKFLLQFCQHLLFWHTMTQLLCVLCEQFNERDIQSAMVHTLEHVTQYNVSKLVNMTYSQGCPLIEWYPYNTDELISFWILCTVTKSPNTFQNLAVSILRLKEKVPT